MQADLLAYYRIMTTPAEARRYELLGSGLPQQSEFWQLTHGKRRHLRHGGDVLEGMRHLRRGLVRDGAPPEAVSWWMTD